LNPRRPTPEDIPSILVEFDKFCKVDLQLADLTVKHHVREIRRFFTVTRLDPRIVGKSDVRNYLAAFSERNPYVYKTVLAALKRFFRDFMGRSDVIEGFRFPKYPIKVKRVPSKRELRKFYNVLKDERERALFLMFATTGLRKNEVLNLKIEDVDLESRMVVPKAHIGRTKHAWVSFFNEECEKALKEYLSKRNDRNPKLFPISRGKLCEMFRRGREKAGVHLNPRILREWFCCEMGKLGVPDRYVDAFCGRVPRSVLARHYTDFSAERLREIYIKANLKALA
jgi:integrase